MAITLTAAISGNLGLAVGNLVGGVAIQTVVLALLDVRSGDRPLTHTVGSLITVLEGSIVIATLAATIMTTQLPADTAVAGISPGSLAIALIWVGALVVVGRARNGIPWKVEAPGAEPGGHHRSSQPFSNRSTGFVAGVFALASLATLGAGVALERSGDALAGRIGLAGAVFGATILAASTALPEVSTGMASVKLGDNALAFADIFGGNAFLPVLFLLADAVAGKPTLPAAKASDIWMASLGLVLTAVYIAGLIVRPRRNLGPIGPDSWIAVGIYVLGIIGLTQIA